MIACDRLVLFFESIALFSFSPVRCEDWFHPACVGITTEQLRKLTDSNGTYVCPLCENSELKNTLISCSRFELFFFFFFFFLSIFCNIIDARHQTHFSTLESPKTVLHD